MYYVNYGLAETLMALRIEEAQRQAMHRCLVRRCTQQSQTWLQRQAGELLRGAGRQLVLLGRRLEGYGPPQPFS